MNIETITIDTMIHGGFAISNPESGRQIRLRLVIPGEEVDITRITDCAELVQIQRKSPDRVEPPCRYYGQCGGCDFQHIRYDRQLFFKQQILQDLFSASPHPDVRAASAQIGLPLASADQFSYRQRIRMHKVGLNRLGFRRFHSHDILPVSSCLLARPEINEVLASLYRHPSFAKLLDHTTEVECAFNPGTGHVTCMIAFSRKPRPADLHHAQNLVEQVDNLERIYFQPQDHPLSAPVHKPGNTAELSFAVSYPDGNPLIAPFTLQWEAGGFCQVNLQQNWRLVELVVSLAGLTGSESVLDLFCGMGNFSLPLARGACQLLGFEGQGAAIRSARQNAASAGCTTASFAKANVHSECQRLANSGEQFDLIIVDPPRAGIPGMSSSIAVLCRNRLIYISCGPESLVRDLASLCTAGFAIRTVQPVDMFPQTHHIETVVVLEKN